MEIWDLEVVSSNHHPTPAGEGFAEMKTYRMEDLVRESGISARMIRRYIRASVVGAVFGGGGFGS